MRSLVALRDAIGLAPRPVGFVIQAMHEHVALGVDNPAGKQHGQLRQAVGVQLQRPPQDVATGG